MERISVIMPVYNAEKWLDECFESILKQTYTGEIELSVYNDNSKDTSMAMLDAWKPRLMDRGIHVKVGNQSGSSSQPNGVGYAKNQAVKQSSGQYLCFLDADDVMHPERLEKQLEAAKQYPKAIVGSQFRREPEGSTERYTKWANSLTLQQLYTQVYTSHGPTVIMPTWFCSRKVFDEVGKFDESGKGTPEDLIFFYKHLRLGGQVVRVDQCLLMYRYHPAATTFSVHEDTIWNVRLAELEDRVLKGWESFTIWNAGKQGRRFYRSLTNCNKAKVKAFCDVDEKKISKGVYIYEDSKERPKPRIPIVHFREAEKPFIICVKQDLTGGGFEANLQSLKLREGVDYFHFN